MATIKAFTDNFKSFYDTLHDAITEEVNNTKDVLLNLNKDQLLYGRDADGNLLAPTYLNDPFFKTKAAAERYYKMKQRLEASHISRIRFGNIQLFAPKPSDVPNLIVNGMFQDRFVINVSGKSFTIDSSYIDGDDINNKYKGRVYGLAPVSKEFYYRHYVRATIFRHYKNKMK